MPENENDKIKKQQSEPVEPKEPEARTLHENFTKNTKKKENE